MPRLCGSVRFDPRQTAEDARRLKPFGSPPLFMMPLVFRSNSAPFADA